jgi:hypothetical protein
MRIISSSRLQKEAGALLFGVLLHATLAVSQDIALTTFPVPDGLYSLSCYNGSTKYSVVTTQNSIRTRYSLSHRIRSRRAAF